MSKYQVIMTSADGRVWDSIKPTMAEAVHRIGEFMSLEDDQAIIRLGDMVVSCGDDYLRAIKIVKEHDFDVTFIEINPR